MKKILTILAILMIGSLAFGETVVSGTFNGQTASPLTIGVGFIPDWVKVYNVEASDAAMIQWSVNNRATESLAGVFRAGTTAPSNVLLTVGTGISKYRGGDILTSTTCTNYLIRDENDQRASGTGAAVTYWTLDTNSTRHGHFDATPSTTLVGEGSRVNINAKWYTVMSMDSDATVKGSVLLDEAAPSGEVNALRPMYDYKVATDGTQMPAGFVITCIGLNVAGNICFFEAGVYDEK